MQTNKMLQFYGVSFRSSLFAKYKKDLSVLFLKGNCYLEVHAKLDALAVVIK